METIEMTITLMCCLNIALITVLWIGLSAIGVPFIRNTNNRINGSIRITLLRLIYLAAAAAMGLGIVAAKLLGWNVIYR